MPLMPGAEPYAHEGGPVGVLVIHGFTGSPKSVTPWARHLAAAGLTVDVPRLPGHGTRWQDMNVTRWEDWYATVDRSLTQLRERCDAVVVAGLSMGGTLALRLAEQRPADVAGLVLVNPAVHSERKDRVLLPYLSRIVPAFPGISNDIKAGGDEGAYQKLPLRAAHSLSQLWTVVKQDITHVTQPLLIFRSVDDHVVEPSNTAWILTHVRSEDRTEVLLHDSFHVATLDNDAPAIFAGSLDFVQRIAAGQSGAGPDRPSRSTPSAGE